VGALRENKGFADLELWHNTGVSDDTWGAICASLATHPTLEVLDHRRPTYGAATTAPPAALKSRVEALLDMLKVSTSIHTLQLYPRYKEHDIFRESIIPYLETNQFPAVPSCHPTNSPNSVPCQDFGKSAPLSSY
jgi:hypothetical protein